MRDGAKRCTPYKCSLLPVATLFIQSTMSGPKTMSSVEGIRYLQQRAPQNGADVSTHRSTYRLSPIMKGRSRTHSTGIAFAGRQVKRLRSDKWDGPLHWLHIFRFRLRWTTIDRVLWSAKGFVYKKAFPRMQEKASIHRYCLRTMTCLTKHYKALGRSSAALRRKVSFRKVSPWNLRSPSARLDKTI